MHIRAIEMHNDDIGNTEFSNSRHVTQSPAAIIAARRSAGNPLRITLTRGPAVARYCRERSADLRLATGSLDRDPLPPWDHDLSLALDRWVDAREAR